MLYYMVVRNPYPYTRKDILLSKEKIYLYINLSFIFSRFPYRSTFPYGDNEDKHT